MITKILEQAITFDDVLIKPNYSEVLPHQVNVTTHITKNIALNIPLLSAAMDTVTESSMAIALARIGGIGIIHKNLSIKNQAEEVKKVKNFESHIVRNPVTINADATMADLTELTAKNAISGVPVCNADGGLIGIVTNRDVRFVTDMQTKIASVMTPKDKLITAKESDSSESVIKLLQQHRIEKMLIVDDAFNLKGLITVTDLKSAQNEPNACKDSSGQLRVGAAIGTEKNSPSRIDALVEAGVDLLVVDTAHGYSKGVFDQVKYIKNNYKIDVMAGNIATGDAARALVDIGADAVKVGIGPGSICTTRIISGVGFPQISAILEVKEALKNSTAKIIADGGIRYSGDIAKALVSGADCVMIGNLFAGTKESPGTMELYQGRSYKNYRGMGSIGAMSQKHGSSDRYFQSNKHNTSDLVPEGIEGRVPYRGKLADIVKQMIGGLRSSMGYTGCQTVGDLHQKAQLCRISNSGMRESHVHNVSIVKESPNYNT